MVKEQKGITLVALIITIIVMLILAGVSISLVIGDNGVITKAQDAEGKQIMAQEREGIIMTFAALYADYYGDTANLTASTDTAKAAKFNNAYSASNVTTELENNGVKLEEPINTVPVNAELILKTETATYTFTLEQAVANGPLSISTAGISSTLNDVTNN